MRHRYRHLDPSELIELLSRVNLDRIFQQLLLASGGDVDQALNWLRNLQLRGYLPDDFDVDAFADRLEDDQVIRRDQQGAYLTEVGERRIRRSAFEELFAGLERGNPGYHPVRASGEGTERLGETRGYRFGDDLHRVDSVRSVHNALRRSHGHLELTESDLEVYETEHMTSCATVVAIDVSHSMVLYGEDRITPARKVALALTELIRTRYPKDSLAVVLFGDRAEQVPLRELPYVDAGPFHTNTRDALRLSRALLMKKKHPNRQILMITDGKPSAITEHGKIYKNPFGLDLKIVNRTLDEADLCRRQRIVLTTFMIATDPTLQQFVEQMTKINRGRAFFASPDRLGEFVLADYIRNRRRRVR